MMLAISIGKFLLVNCASYSYTCRMFFTTSTSIGVRNAYISLFLIISFGFFMQFALNNLQQVFKMISLN